MHYTYQPEHTCSTALDFDIENGKVHNVQFTGGCNGNLKATPLLLDGWKAEEIGEKLHGITCGRRPTSCADQLAIAIFNAMKA